MISGRFVFVGPCRHCGKTVVQGRMKQQYKHVRRLSGSSYIGCRGGLTTAAPKEAIFKA